MEVTESTRPLAALFAQHQCCVLIPTYNNAQFLGPVLQDVGRYCNDIVVVNDGSTDATLSVLAQFPDVQVLSYPKNRGKGHALKKGFRFAWQKGYRYAISIDSDGQHYARDLVVFLELLDQHPKALIVGARNLDQENMNKQSSFANKFSNFWFRVETGLDLPDTQSGYRLYPLEALHKTSFFTSRYEFEIEVMVRSAWKGVELLSAPIDVFYPVAEERVSHFRPFKDFFRISVLNTVLVLMAFFYHHPRRVFNVYRKKNLRDLWRELRQSLSQLSPKKTALSIGFGVFMGIFPIWGYQLLVGFVLAHWFSLHKGLFFVAANISLPPMIPLILYLSYVTGSYMLGAGSWQVNFDLSLAAIGDNLLQYLLGAVGFSVLAGMVAALLSYLLLMLRKSK